MVFHLSVSCLGNAEGGGKRGTIKEKHIDNDCLWNLLPIDELLADVGIQGVHGVQPGCKQRLHDDADDCWL